MTLVMSTIIRYVTRDMVELWKENIIAFIYIHFIQFIIIYYYYSILILQFIIAYAIINDAHYENFTIFHMWINSGVFGRSAYQTGIYHITQARFSEGSMADHLKHKKGTKSILIFNSCLECNEMLCYSFYTPDYFY